MMWYVVMDNKAANRRSSFFSLPRVKEDVDAELTAYKADLAEVNKMSSSENLGAT
jgi:hypothetical protein